MGGALLAVLNPNVAEGAEVVLDIVEVLSGVVTAGLALPVDHNMVVSAEGADTS